MYRLEDCMSMSRQWSRILLLIVGGSVGCGSGNWTINVEGREKTIVVPSTASTQPAYNSTGAPPPRRYVVRMSDGNLDWEVELPEVATGYELRIPFKDKNKNTDVNFIIF